MKLIKFIRNTDAFFLKKTRRIKPNLFFKICSNLGNFFVVLAIIVATFFLPTKSAHLTAAVCLVALAIDTIAVFIIKYTVKRTRPCTVVGLNAVLDPFSFPSGHISRLATVAVASYNITILSIILILMMIICWISRQITRHHYVSDCFFGSLIGILCGIATIYLIDSSILPLRYFLHYLGL